MEIDAVIEGEVEMLRLFGRVRGKRGERMLLNGRLVGFRGEKDGAVADTEGAFFLLLFRINLLCKLSANDLGCRSIGGAHGDVPGLYVASCFRSGSCRSLRGRQKGRRRSNRRGGRRSELVYCSRFSSGLRGVRPALDHSFDNAPRRSRSRECSRRLSLPLPCGLQGPSRRPSRIG